VMRERDIEHYLVKRVKAMGGEVRKVKWIGRAAAPDRLVMLPVSCSAHDFGHPDRCDRAPRHFYAEIKPPGGLATFPKNAHERRQLREHDRMRSFGVSVCVIDSLKLVDEVLA
jgi:hypothetical protein